MQDEYAIWGQDTLDAFHDQHHMPMLAAVKAVYQASPDNLPESIAEAFNQISPVSYTHLTLPTICSV